MKTNQLALRIRFSTIAMTIAALALGPGIATSVRAQIPDKFDNLQILDKGIGKRELVGKMRDFAGALGVRCNYCHVGEDARTLQNFDWASDDKREKRAAREMMRMVQAINDSYVGKVATEHPKRVTVGCVTCHRGQERPWLIQDVLRQAFDDGGVAPLAAKYRELRERYHGRHTYDFSDNVLSNMAQDLAVQDNLDAAVELLELNLEYYPEHAMTYVLLARVAEERGEQNKAVAYFEKAIEHQPNEQMKARLRAMMESAKNK